MSKIKDYFYDEMIGLDALLASEDEFWANEMEKQETEKNETETNVKKAS